MKLFKNSEHPPTFINRVKISAVQGDATVIQIIGDVVQGDPWGNDEDITLAKVTEVLDQVTTPRLIVEINSGGGHVFDGMAIYQAFKAFKGQVETRVMALAGSIASIIFMAGSKRTMPEDGGMLFIHNATGFVYGEKGDMLDMATTLGKIDQMIAAVYHNRTGMTLAEVSKAMDKATFYTGAQALENGLATHVEDYEAVIDNSLAEHLSESAKKVLVPSTEKVVAKSDKSISFGRAARIRLGVEMTAHSSAG